MKTNRRIFDFGDKVRSHYASPWLGIIMNYYIIPDADNKSSHWIYVVLAVIDKNGQKIRKPFVTSLDGAWLSKSTETFDVPANLKDYEKLCKCY